MLNRLAAALLALLCVVAPARANDIGNSTWSETDASNTAAAPQGWSGSIRPSEVEPTARAMMGAIKRWYNRTGPTVTSGGSANAQTLTYSVAPQAYVTGDEYTFKAGFSNSGSTTLNVNALGAKTIKSGAATLTGGELASGQIVTVYYDGTDFQLPAASRFGPLTIGNNVLAAGGGSTTAVYGTSSPTIWGIAQGTDASPVTSAGQQIRMLYRHNVSNTLCNNNGANTGCVSPLLINAIGGATTNMVTSAATFYAETNSNAGLGVSNAQGINALGWAKSGANGAGMGAYIQGIRDGTSGKIRGAEISTWNRTNTDCPNVGYVAISDCVGINLAARGNDLTSTRVSNGAGMQLLSVAGLGFWQEGIIFSQDSVSEKSINDQSDSTVSINIEGTHTYGIASAPSAGRFGFGTLTPHARVQIAGDRFYPNWGAGIALEVTDAVYTDSTATGSAGDITISYFGVPTIAASNAATFQDAANVRIARPVAGSNVTLTRAFALIAAQSRIGGITLNGDTPISVSAGEIAIGQTRSTDTALCGSLAGAAGCWEINVGGVTRHVPYF